MIRNRDSTKLTLKQKLETDLKNVITEISNLKRKYKEELAALEGKKIRIRTELSKLIRRKTTKPSN